MRIPSYDDLTPSIPDVGPDEVLTSAATVLPQGGPIASRQAPSSGPPCALYAALHGAAVDRLAAIAHDFSPRIERSPGGTVVLDVSGLQRLLGTPAAIAADLVQAGAPRVAVAVSQIAAVLLARAQAGATVAIGEPETALREVPLGVLEQWTMDVDAAAIAARPCVDVGRGGPGVTRPPLRRAAALGPVNDRRARGAAGGESVGPARSGRRRRAAAGARPRSAAAHSRPGRAALRRVVRARMADRDARAVVVRARAAARSAGGGARAGRSRRRGAPPRAAPHRSDDARPGAAAAGADARSARAAHAAAARSRIASPGGGDRHRHRSRSIRRLAASSSIRCSSARCRRRKRWRR